MRRIHPLGPQELLVETNWGGFVVVPTFNIDVTIGVTRDGVHEAWTTRLVQELLRPGQTYLNAGANFGYYVALAGRVLNGQGMVIGVEPNPHILSYLLKTVYWNGSPHITRIVKRALSDSIGEALEFAFDPQYLGGGSTKSLRDETAGRNERSFEGACWGADTVDQLFDRDGIWENGRGLMVSFDTSTTTITHVCDRLGVATLDLLHLDIEGSEPLALRGAADVIRRSPGLRMITEWSCGHYQHSSPRVRAAFDESLALLESLGYRVRLLEPRLAEDGGLFVSPCLSGAFLRESAPHADYVWLRAGQDPFGD